MNKSEIDLYEIPDITKRCAQILIRKIPPKLKVQIGGVEVTAAGLASVGHAILSRKIRVGVFTGYQPIGDGSYGALPGGSVDLSDRMAVYRVGKNELWLSKKPLKPKEEAIVAHEATHAFFDMHKRDCKNRIAEASAFAVEGWYLWKEGFRPEKDTREAKMITLARIIARIVDPVRRGKFKKKYPKDWKERNVKQLTAAYNALLNNLRLSYDLKQDVDFDGVD